MGDDQVYKILEQICQNNVRSYTFPDKIKNYLTVDKFFIFQYFLDASLRYLKRDLSETFHSSPSLYWELSHFSIESLPNF